VEVVGVAELRLELGCESTTADRRLSSAEAGGELGVR
jgi:hypothetical protein